MIKIVDTYPDRATYRPNDQARIQVKLANTAERLGRATVRARLMALQDELARAEQPVDLEPLASVTAELALRLPAGDWRGYGVEVELIDAHDQAMAQATTALDVASDWTRAPRYGFVADFTPDEDARESEQRLASLARYHLNALQFYDWMYRHQLFLPPATEFIDPLGRRLSLDVVTRKVRLAHEFGMQALAYVAIYGAAPDYIAEHPEQGFYCSDGTPYTLGDWLYITNIAHPSWQEQLFSECRRAISSVGFDGIHLDQYGYVRTGYTRDGSRVDVEAELPDFLNAARSAVDNAPAVFNAVGNWPVAAVARSSVEPLYIEVWPPNDSLRDLREIIVRARDLRHGRAPVLAAYLSDFLSADPAAQAGAAHALRRLTAAIYLNGGSHIMLGEENGVLRHPYFPNYYRLTPEQVRAVRADYDFIARYAEYLFDPAWRDISVTSTGGINEDIRLDVPRFGPHAEPDSIWTIARMRDHELTLGLINLCGMASTAWNAPQPAPRQLRDVRVTLQMERPIQAAYFASPDCSDGRPIPLQVQQSGRVSTLILRELAYWGLLIVQFSAG
ncbi:MAG: hypothetical protein H3C34_01485 [Caldilineaceae bacterium]|nr:hypothetical protein [Caldilineaceae bacterium]